VIGVIFEEQTTTMFERTVMFGRRTTWTFCARHALP